MLWGHLQFGLGGDNMHVRELYRSFLEEAKGKADSGPAWEKAVAAYKEKAKKPFKPKELDGPVKTFIKDLAKKAKDEALKLDPENADIKAFEIK